MARQPQGANHRSQAGQSLLSRRRALTSLAGSHLRLAQTQTNQGSIVARQVRSYLEAAAAKKRAPPELQMKLAAIDIGSNAVRLLFVNVYEEKDGPNFKKA